MKPYRLINSAQLDKLYALFADTLELWNQNYSLHPVTLGISVPTPNNVNTYCYYVKDAQEQILACIPDDYYHLLNQALFGEQDDAYKPCSEELFLRLLAELFHTEACSMQTVDKQLSWLYPGSAAVVLHFSCTSSTCSILVNPAWVHQALPLKKKQQQNLSSLDEALAKKNLRLSVELDSMTISLQQLLDLQIGDVIKTDHQCSDRLRLVYEQKTYATTELGALATTKSIIIKEFT